MSTSTAMTTNTTTTMTTGRAAPAATTTARRSWTRSTPSWAAKGPATPATCATAASTPLTITTTPTRCSSPGAGRPPGSTAGRSSRRCLAALATGEDYGYILRAKGMVPCDDGQTWLHFDLVPEEFQVREGAADYTGRPVRHRLRPEGGPAGQAVPAGVRGRAYGQRTPASPCTSSPASWTAARPPCSPTTLNMDYFNDGERTVPAAVRGRGGGVRPPVPVPAQLPPGAPWRARSS